MEYSATTARTATHLAPLAASARNFCACAGRSLDASMKQIESAKPFDDKAYAGRLCRRRRGALLHGMVAVFFGHGASIPPPRAESLLAQAVRASPSGPSISPTTA